MDNMRLEVEIRRYIAYWNAAKDAFYAYYHFADMPDDVKCITTFAAQLLDESNRMHIDVCKIADSYKLLHGVFCTENTLRDNIEMYLNGKNKYKHKEDPVVVAFRWLILCEREIALLYTTMIARKVLDYYAHDRFQTHPYFAMHCRLLIAYMNTLAKQRLFLYENFSNYCDHLRNMRFPSLSFKNYDLNTMKKDLEQFSLSHRVELEKMQTVLQENCCDLETMTQMFSVTSNGVKSFKPQQEKNDTQKNVDMRSARAYAQHLSKSFSSGLSKLQSVASNDVAKSQANASALADESKTTKLADPHLHSEGIQLADHSLYESSMSVRNDSESFSQEWHDISLDDEPMQGVADAAVPTVNGENRPSIARMLFPKTPDRKFRDDPGIKLSLSFSSPPARHEKKSSEEHAVSLKDLRERKMYFDMVHSCPHRFFATMNTLVSATLKSQDAIKAHGEMFSQRVLTQLLGYLQLFLLWRGDCDALQEDILKENKANSVYQVFSVLSNQYDQKVQMKTMKGYLQIWARYGIPGKPKKKKAIVDNVVRDAANWSVFFEASRQYLHMNFARNQTLQPSRRRVYVGFFAVLVSTAALVSYAAMAAYASVLTPGLLSVFIAQGVVNLLWLLVYKHALERHESRYHSAWLNKAFRRIPKEYQQSPIQHAVTEKKSVMLQKQGDDVFQSSVASELYHLNHDEAVIKNADIGKSQYQWLPHPGLEVDNSQNNDTDSDTSSVSSFSLQDEDKRVNTDNEVKLSVQRCLQNAEPKVDAWEDDESKSDMSFASASSSGEVASSSSREVASSASSRSEVMGPAHAWLKNAESKVDAWEGDERKNDMSFASASLSSEVASSSSSEVASSVSSRSEVIGPAHAWLKNAESKAASEGDEKKSDMSFASASSSSEGTSSSSSEVASSVSSRSEVIGPAHAWLKNAESKAASEGDERKSDMSFASASSSSEVASSSSRQVASSVSSRSEVIGPAHAWLKGVETKMVKDDSDSIGTESFFIGKQLKTSSLPKNKGKQKMRSTDISLSSCSQFQSHTSISKEASCHSHQY